MATSLYVAINSVVVSQYVETIAPKPTGPGVLGACPMTLKKIGGGLTINPLHRVQVARLDNAGHFEKRLFQGVVTIPEQRGAAGDTHEYWDVTCADANILGKRIVTPKAFTVTLASANFDVQVVALVLAVQTSVAGTYEQIDCTQVGNLHSSMPGVTYDGGHCLDWYLDQLAATVRQATSGAVDPARYMDVDSTAGASTFGGVILRYYDAAGSGSSVATYTDSNNTIRGYWRRKIDGGMYYQRRAAEYTGGYAETTGPAPLGNPWFAGGWCAEPMKVNTTDGAVALAALRADLAHNGALVETVRIPVGNINEVPGDTVTITLALPGVNALYRVAEANRGFQAQSTDNPLTELVLGTSPRRLGSGAIIGGGGVVLSDVLAPTPPANAPTVLTNHYDAGNRKTWLGLRALSSVSLDTAALQLTWTVNGATPQLGPWVDCGPAPLTADFPLFVVLPGSTVVVRVRARDGANNISDWGPNAATVHAASYLPGPTPGPVPTFGGYDPDSVEVNGLTGWAAQPFTGSVTPHLVQKDALTLRGGRMLELSLDPGARASYLSDPFTAQAGTQYDMILALYTTDPTGLTPSGIVHWQDYNGDDLSTWSAPLPALVAGVWVESPVMTTPAAPAGTVAARWEIGGTTSTNASLLAFAEPLATDWVEHQPVWMPLVDDTGTLILDSPGGQFILVDVAPVS